MKRRAPWDLSGKSIGEEERGREKTKKEEEEKGRRGKRVKRRAARNPPGKSIVLRRLCVYVMWFPMSETGGSFVG